LDFLYEIFLKSLDEYIRKNQTDNKGKLSQEKIDLLKKLNVNFD